MAAFTSPARPKETTTVPPLLAAAAARSPARRGQPPRTPSSRTGSPVCRQPGVTVGALVRELEGHTQQQRVACLELVGGNQVWSGAAGGTIAVHDAQTGRFVRALAVPGRRIAEEDYISCLLFTGGNVWCGCSDGTVDVLTPDGRCLAQWDAHAGSVKCLAASARFVWSGSLDKTVRAWDPETAELRKALSGHRNWVNCLATIDGRVWSGADDCAILVWDEETGELLHDLQQHAGQVLALAVVGRYVWSGGADGALVQWDAPCAQLVRELHNHSGWVNALLWAGDFVWSASGDGTIVLWDPQTGDAVRTIQAHNGWVWCLLGVGGTVWSGSGDNTIRVWLADEALPAFDLTQGRNQAERAAEATGDVERGTAGSPIVDAPTSSPSWGARPQAARSPEAGSERAATDDVVVPASPLPHLRQTGSAVRRADAQPVADVIATAAAASPLAPSTPPPPPPPAAAGTTPGGRATLECSPDLSLDSSLSESVDPAAQRLPPRLASAAAAAAAAAAASAVSVLLAIPSRADAATATDAEAEHNAAGTAMEVAAGITATGNAGCTTRRSFFVDAATSTPIGGVPSPVAASRAEDLPTGSHPHRSSAALADDAQTDADAVPTEAGASTSTDADAATAAAAASSSATAASSSATAASPAAAAASPAAAAAASADAGAAVHGGHTFGHSPDSSLDSSLSESVEFLLSDEDDEDGCDLTPPPVVRALDVLARSTPLRYSASSGRSAAALLRSPIVHSGSAAFSHGVMTPARLERATTTPVRCSSARRPAPAVSPFRFGDRSPAARTDESFRELTASIERARVRLLQTLDRSRGKVGEMERSTRAIRERR